MIRENQRFLNHLNMALDALLVFLAWPLSFWIRFYVFHGIPSVPLSRYIEAALILAPLHVLIYAFLGMYESVRKKRLYQDLGRIFWANALGLVLLQMALFLIRGIHFSRGVIAIDFFLVNFFTGGKRIFVRKVLRHFRGLGYNQKHIILLGSGPLAVRYVREVKKAPELGLTILGYISDKPTAFAVKYLGNFEQMAEILDKRKPDEAVAALEMTDYERMPALIQACEKSGVRLSLIPFYADYMPSKPQIDSLNGLPLINLRRIPLDNLGNAFMKRTMDIFGSLVLILLTSPLMLIAAIGVRLSSPGPVIFKQKRVGLNKKSFYMYKFRSMRINDSSDTAWSTDRDDRKTRFGAFIRKFSIDELPQFFNVLKGDMSLVGPRPEVPFYVEQFKEEVPLYMVKHQVRPGITGWAQVNGLRGDTSIEERIRHDVYYIENWTLLFDVKILLMTLFKGVKNQEKLQ